MALSFAFGGDNKNDDYESLKRRRALAEAMMQRGGRSAPKTAIAGANSAANSILGAIMAKKAGKVEAGKRDEYNTLFNSVLGSATGYGSLPGFTGGSYTPPEPEQRDQYPVGTPVTGNESTPPEYNMGTPVQPDLAGGIVETANAIGMNPHDLATIISYETGGTFDPTKAGPTTQWGQHRGLIQFGEPQAKQYGVDWNNPIGSQLGPDGAVARYFKENGFQPGMGLLDAYSIVNAGGPGRYNASDANNGGAPGSVADKVNNQMSGHAQKAAALLGGSYTPAQGPAPQQQGINPMLLAAMGNPWASDAQRSVLGMLMQQQMKNNDPMRQMQMAQMQQQLNAPPELGIQELADGRKYYVDPTGQQEPRLVNPDLQVTPGMLDDPAKVQSSEILPDGSVIAIMNNGDPVVRAPSGEVLQGQQAADAIRAARKFGVDNQRSIYGARTTGKNVAEAQTGAAAAAAGKLGEETIKQGMEAYQGAAGVQRNLGNIDDAIAALDSGAEAGAVQKFLPNITESSASLQNAMDRMGLDVIGSVTFGALSEGELRLAMQTAVPRDLSPPELRNWLVKKRAAQQKAANTLMDAAYFLTTPGNTINDWIARNRQRQAPQTAPQVPQATPQASQAPVAPVLPEIPDFTSMSDEELDAYIARGKR